MAAPDAVPESFLFDESKIFNAGDDEKQALSLLQWLANVEKDTNKSPRDVLKRHQATLETTLLRILTFTSPKPLPTRPIRRSVARCFLALFANGDTRSVFDVLAALQKSLTEKNVPEINKLAYIYVLGVLSEARGANVLSLFAESVSLCTKILKTSTDLALRHDSLIALSQILTGQGRTAQESAVKDLVKIGKSGLADKVTAIRCASAELLRAVFKYTSTHAPFTTPSDFDSLVGSFIKCFESSSYSLRKSVSSLVATVLSRSQHPAPDIKQKKSAKTSNNDPVSTTSTRNILSVDEMMELLSGYFVKSTSREVRVGIIESYAALFKSFGVKWVETNYAVVTRHVIDLAGISKLTATKPDAMFVRELCSFLLRDVVGKMLSENAQMSAVKDLTNLWLRKYPTEVPAKNSLICALTEVASLLVDLGPAGSGVAVEVLEPFHALLNHTSNSVNVALAWCMRCLCTSSPAHLPKLMMTVIELMQKESSNLSDRTETLKKFSGLANILSALIAVVRDTRCIYVSFELLGRAFALAVQLQRAGSTATLKDFRIMTVQSQVAWTIISSMMNIGSNFSKVHTSQILLLWKSTFPKQTAGKEFRTDVEWMYLIGVRDAAMACLQNFLIHNSSLVTADGAKRITLLLNNTLSFLNSLPSSYPSPAITIIEQQLRKRLYSCYKLITPTNSYESVHTLLLAATRESFLPEADKLTVNESVKGAVYPLVGGIDITVSTSLVKGLHAAVASQVSAEERGVSRAVHNDIDFARVERMIEPGAIGTLEYDNHALYFSPAQSSGSHETLLTTPTPVPANIGMIDSAIELYAFLLAVQSSAIQEQFVEMLGRILKAIQGSKVSAGKKLAMKLNVVTVLLGALKYITMKKDSAGQGKVYDAMRDIALDSLNSSNENLRAIAAECLGYLARVVTSPSFNNNLVQSLVDQVITNRDPDTRAGCSLALGCILSQMGGMAASSHLKMAVNVLQSLAEDTHPTVHTWALHSLWLTVESSGLMYGQYVNSTLAMIVKLLMAESHEPITASSHPANKTGETDTYSSFGRILYALINTIGPELSSSSKTRDLCLYLYEEFKNDSDVFVVVEAIRCIQHFITFAPACVDVPMLIPFLQRQLSGDYHSQVPVLRKAAVTCLYQLTQRNPAIVLSSSHDLEEQLFALLDTETDQMVRDEIKDILIGLLKFVAPTNPSRWLDLCKKILSKTGAASSTEPASQASRGIPVALNDDDDDMMHSDDGPKSPTHHSAPDTPVQVVIVVLLPRWRTQIFAMTSLRQCLNVVKNTSKKEHFDLALARRQKKVAESQGGQSDYLVFRLSDLVRMGFTAATANVDDLRLEGLQVLKDILEKFRETQDPDFENHALLEQYQAQFGSALSPAFSAEASPEVTATACQVCAAYVSSGVNQELGTLSRVLKLLSSSLEYYRENSKSQSTALSPQANVIIKLAVLTAWAELHLASYNQTYLQEAVAPNLPVLAKIWVQLLRDYARVKIDADLISSSLIQSNSDDGVADIYLAATKEVLLPYYKRSWVVLLRSVASLTVHTTISTSVFKGEGSEVEDKPKMFHVLFGLAIEALSGMGMGNQTANTFSGMGDVNVTKALVECLTQFFRPSIVGDTFVSKEVYLEIVSVLDRLLQIEEVSVQLAVVQLVHRVIADYGVTYLIDDLETNEGLSSTVDSKVHVTIRLLFNVVKYHIPSISNDPLSSVYAHRKSTPETAALLSFALESLSTLVSSMSASTHKQIFMDLFPIVMSIFMAIFQAEKFSIDVAPRVLVCLKSVLESAPADIEAEEGIVSTRITQSLATSLLGQVVNDVEEILSIQPGRPVTPLSDYTMTKNSMLAMVLILSSAPHLCDSQPIQDKFLRALKKLAFQNESQISCAVMSVQCLRTLMTVCARPSRVDAGIGHYYVHSILVDLIVFCVENAKDATKMNDTGLKVVVEECLKSLVLMYSLQSDEDSKTQMLAIVLPVFILFLDPPTSASSNILHGFSASSLFALASTAPIHFKAVLMSLPDASKLKIQAALTALAMSSGGNSGAGSGTVGNAKPAITLKANFAGF